MPTESTVPHDQPGGPPGPAHGLALEGRHRSDDLHGGRPRVGWALSHRVAAGWRCRPLRMPWMTAMSVPTLLPSAATLWSCPGPPNWLNPNVPSVPAAAPAIGRRRQPRALAGSSIVACLAVPSSAQCPAVRTKRLARPGLKAPNPAEQMVQAVNDVPLAAEEVLFRRDPGTLVPAPHWRSGPRSPPRRSSGHRLGSRVADCRASAAPGPSGLGRVRAAGADDEVAVGVGHGLQPGGPDLADVGLEQLLGARRRPAPATAEAAAGEASSPETSHRGRPASANSPGPAAFSSFIRACSSAPLPSTTILPSCRTDPYIAGQPAQGGHGVGGPPGQRAGGVELLKGHAQVPSDRLGESGVADVRRWGRSGRGRRDRRSGHRSGVGAAWLTLTDGAGETGAGAAGPSSARAGTA